VNFTSSNAWGRDMYIAIILFGDGQEPIHAS
jgi:hypothetical protein